MAEATRPKHIVVVTAALLQLSCCGAPAAELTGEVRENITPSKVENSQSASSDTTTAKEALNGKSAVLPAPIDNFKLGLELMKSCSYAKALDAFNAAARENPASAEPHFARARALLGLGRRDEAYKEFKLCTLLDPSGRMEQKCKSEIYMAGLGAPLDFNNQPRTITNLDLERATTNITNQAESEIQRVQDNALSRSNSIRRMDSESMMSPYPNSSGRWFGYGRFPTSRGGYVSLSCSGNRPGMSNWVGGGTYESNATRRARELSEGARLRSEALREAATGLNENMSNRPSEYSGVYLSPHGTNLFVRNYVNFEPVRPEPPEALEAKALSLAEDRKLTNSEKLVSRNMPGGRSRRRYK